MEEEKKKKASLARARAVQLDLFARASHTGSPFVHGNSKLYVRRNFARINKGLMATDKSDT